MNPTTRNQIGRLRHRVTFQEPTRTQDSFGDPIISWADWGTRWGQVTPLSGLELIQAVQVDSAVSHRIRCRAEGIKGVALPDWRVIYDNRIFEIKACRDQQEQGWYVEFDVTELVGESPESGSGGR